MEQFLVGILIGFVVGIIITLFLWTQSDKSNQK